MYLDETIQDPRATPREYCGAADSARFQHFVPPGATKINSDMPLQDDKEPRYRRTLLAQHLSRVEMSNRPVSDQPCKLLAGRRADGLVLGESIDEIGVCHATLQDVVREGECYIPIRTAVC